MVALFVLATLVVLLVVELIVGKLEGRRLVVATEAPAGREPGALVAPEGIFFHRGHSWARVEKEGVVTVGVDEFTRHMAGQPDSISLPDIGSKLTQGAKGWALRRGDREIPMLAPVDGEVIELNDQTLCSPETVAADPYRAGWLLKVKATNLRSNLANLLDGSLAARWMEDTSERLNRFFSPELGVVMQDGGMLAEGVIESVELERVPEILREFFLIEAEEENQ